MVLYLKWVPCTQAFYLTPFPVTRQIFPAIFEFYNKNRNVYRFSQLIFQYITE